MSHIIKIRGKQEPLVVDNKKGLQVKGLYFDYHEKKITNIPLSIHNWNGTISDIANIEQQKETSKSNQASQSHTDYAKTHSNFVKLNSPKDKATKKKKYISLLHYIITKKKIEDESDEFKLDIFTKAINFYKDNPKRMFVDPMYLFEEGIYSKAALKATECGIGFVEKLIMADVRQSKVYN